MFVNKYISLKIQQAGFDIARQVIWKNADDGKIDKKKAEKILMDMDASMRYNEMMLHDVISGKDSNFVTEIKKNGQVMMGHQAQGVYFTMNWEDIHQMSKDILEFIEQQTKRSKEETQKLLELLNKGLISPEDFERFKKEYEFPTND